VPLVVGTDCNISGTVAGFSFHAELGELARVGISPADLLRMAILNAATALRMEADLGTVEVGKRADLVLLEANPLDDPANARRIGGIILRGKWYPQSQLRERLATAMRDFTVLDRRLRLTVRRPDLR
jgi:imidazolonepropionase-like amidohydrolase